MAHEHQPAPAAVEASDEARAGPADGTAAPHRPRAPHGAQSAPSAHGAHDTPRHEQPASHQAAGPAGGRAAAPPEGGTPGSGSPGAASARDAAAAEAVELPVQSEVVHGEPGAAPPDPASRIAQLEAELAAAQAEAAANWDKYLRERAEMENFKKRVERTYADLARRSKKELLLKVLGVADNLERALAYENTTGEPVDVRSLLTGVRMTYAQLRDLLSAEGVSEIKTVGERFDPALHEAVAAEPLDGRQEGEIVAELQKGYMLDGELLRPARVKVATKE